VKKRDIDISDRLNGIREDYQMDTQALLKVHAGAVDPEEIERVMLKCFSKGLHGAEVDSLFRYFRENKINDTAVGEFLGLSRTAVVQMRKNRSIDSSHMSAFRHFWPSSLQFASKDHIILSAFSDATTFLSKLATQRVYGACTPQKLWYALAAYTDEGWHDAINHPDLDVGRMKAKEILDEWSIHGIQAERTESSLSYLREIEEDWGPFGVLTLCLLPQRTYSYRNVIELPL